MMFFPAAGYGNVSTPVTIWFSRRTRWRCIVRWTGGVGNGRNGSW